jgi:hypothetical protein
LDVPSGAGLNCTHAECRRLSVRTCSERATTHSTSWQAFMTVAPEQAPSRAREI